MGPLHTYWGGYLSFFLFELNILFFVGAWGIWLLCLVFHCLFFLNTTIFWGIALFLSPWISDSSYLGENLTYFSFPRCSLHFPETPSIYPRLPPFVGHRQLKGWYITNGHHIISFARCSTARGADFNLQGALFSLHLPDAQMHIFPMLPPFDGHRQVQGRLVVLPTGILFPILQCKGGKWQGG